MSDQDVLLKITASCVSDLEQLKLQVQNRLRQLTRGEADSDGKIRGLGLGTDHEVVTALATISDTIERSEGAMVKVLERQVRTHPCGAWAKRTKGAGLKTTGRLLGAIGDPYLRPGHDGPDEEWIPEQPRTLAQLYAYCGMNVRGGTTDGTPGGAAPVRRRGERGNWSAEARLRLYVMADRQVIGGAYRPLYDLAREKYADAVHAAPCVRCGPSGSPAQPGTPLGKAHQHARALRIVSKAMLRDLYREAREYHELPEDADATSAPEVIPSHDRVRIPSGPDVAVRAVSTRAETPSDDRPHRDQPLPGGAIQRAVATRAWTRASGKEADDQPSRGPYIPRGA